MKRTRGILKDKLQTSDNIKYLVKKYHTDLDGLYTMRNGVLIPLSKLSLHEFFNIIRRIPYRKDKKPIEIIARPYHIMRHRSLGMDCKKKSIMMGSFLHKNRKPYRFIGSSKRPDRRIHHIFAQTKISGKWRNVDPTYPFYGIFEDKYVTNHELL